MTKIDNAEKDVVHHMVKINLLQQEKARLFIAILGNPKIYSAMALAMSIYRTLCVLVFFLNLSMDLIRYQNRSAIALAMSILQWCPTN